MSYSNPNELPNSRLACDIRLSTTHMVHNPTVSVVHSIDSYFSLVVRTPSSPRAQFHCDRLHCRYPDRREARHETHNDPYDQKQKHVLCWPWGVVKTIV